MPEHALPEGPPGSPVASAPQEQDKCDRIFKAHLKQWAADADYYYYGAVRHISKTRVEEATCIDAVWLRMDVVMHLVETRLNLSADENTN